MLSNVHLTERRNDTVKEIQVELPKQEISKETFGKVQKLNVPKETFGRSSETIQPQAAQETFEVMKPEPLQEEPSLPKETFGL